MPSQQDKAAEWMRSLSERLWSSHHGSAQLQHSVAKGRTRETQVLNIFEGLLPRGITVGQDVVIVDSTGKQAPNFDGLIYDRIRFPVLYFEKDSRGEESTASALLESVLLCFETKSKLNKDELDDTIQKITRLESLQSVNSSSHPPVLLFAYEAENMNLSFIDYCAAFSRKPSCAPNLVCVLNKGVFMAAKKADANAVPSLVIEPTSYPVYAQSGKETLLLTYFLVAKLSASSPEIHKIIEAYVQKTLEKVSLFSFEPEFVSKLCDNGFHTCVRKKFFRTADKSIVEVYEALNL